MVFMMEGVNTDITVYHNKVEQTGSPTNDPATFTTGSGTTVIGRFSPDQELFYGSVTLDELAMWNRALSEAEVAQLYDMVSQ